ncbi:MAG TPA: hypothetical protein VGU71_01665 [Candidatus Dormibacteraeota bacterium]|nr:hypothetical protein [Candidatus Dormibacteraeota bacterium]
MSTPGRKGALVLVAAVLACACSVPGIGATRSPSPVAATATPGSTPSGAPSPTRPLGVLVNGLAESNYTVSLVGSDGRVIASAQAATPPSLTCANGAAGVLPVPVSTSDTRAYYMDAQGVIRYLSSNGDVGRATTVPIGPARRSSFAVSPDDSRIAVVVIDFTASGAAIKLYVEDLNGAGHHLDTFSDSGAFILWATGWHGTGNLIVEKMPACGGPFCCGDEFHVVDPTTAVRRFTVGALPCKIAGTPSPAGVVCETDTQANVVSWTGATTRSFAIDHGFAHAYLSPDGSLVALWSNDGTLIQESKRTFPGMLACGWIDDTHFLSAGDAQQQTRVANVTTGQILPVPALGFCAGRLPGGL